MQRILGKSAFGGIAIGRVVELKKQEHSVRRERVDDAQEELGRFEIAKEKSVKQLKELYDKALCQVGEANAAIFEVHQMMLEDDDYLDAIKNIIITQNVNAAYAVASTGDNFAEMFASMEDDYMKARAADVKDISDRVVRNLAGDGDDSHKLTQKCIIVADDLAPSETVQLDKEMVLAFVTRTGSTNSHTAILARTMNIPALVTVPVPIDVNGKMAIVDGFNGELVLEPNQEVLDEYTCRQNAEMEKRALLLELKGKPNKTNSGKEIKLYANIGGVGDVAAVLHNDAGGIGLFRSEFLYLQEDDYPSENDQFKAYRAVAEMMGGKEVVIRTLDIGADKQIDYFDLEREENPALGYRAIRICLTREDIFRTQLRALYRASAFGKISIMIPMITSMWEVERAKNIASEVKSELDSQGVPYDENLQFGIMIETPAAVMIADELAREVDFFSIGTNDLTQYTLAIDRQNPKLDMFYDEKHPAILKMIQNTVESGHKAGIWVGICGELGANLDLTHEFIRMGVDELSVSPSMVLPVRKKIRDME